VVIKVEVNVSFQLALVYKNCKRKAAVASNHIYRIHYLSLYPNLNEELFQASTSNQRMRTSKADSEKCA
jgi:hypothetical protein